ncbi:phosphatase PAP2 family protein [Patescibacteria group bacterium]|nr:phosphatase PAP2 family protein [Patescibacteria group bacterium]MCL5091931.1 phosphatase PAP2 family protein [Patescibacteria group bacterium]
MLTSLDFQLTNAIYHLLPHNAVFDRLFTFFSLDGDALLIWIIVILVTILIEELYHPGIQKRDKKFIFYFLASFVVTALLVNYGIKNLIRRPRPFTNPLAVITGPSCPVDYSFPSSHAATAFASATVLAFFDRKRRWLYYLIAGLIALSRIYLYCHYLFDIVAGGLIGTFIAQTTLRLKSHLLQHLGNELSRCQAI